jgi:hypothetical protein
MNGVNCKKTFLFSRTGKDWLVPALISVVYLTLSFFLVGIGFDKLFLVVLFNTLYFLSDKSRKFILGFSIFIFYWILYDYMKAFPNYSYNNVHIADLYYLEKEYFGIWLDGTKITLNEYLVTRTSTASDIIMSLFYLCWIPLPLGFAFYLFRRNKRQFLAFSFAFFLTNITGFIIYYLYPAAPPWYVADYGFSLILKTPGSAAGLLRFDELINFSLFEMMYLKGSNVFAAVPSLHCSYPVLVLFYGLKYKCGKKNIIFFIIMIGIWCASVYLNHHYIIDVIAGILVAIAGIFLLEMLMKSKRVRKVMNKYYKAIE